MFTPGTSHDYTYEMAPEVIDLDGPYFDYLWSLAKATAPLLLEPGQGMPVSMLKHVPVSRADPVSPITIDRSQLRMCFKPFDDLNGARYGVPENEMELRLAPKLCPLPETGLSLKPATPHLCAVNFPCRRPGLPVSVHVFVRDHFHGVLIDTRCTTYGHTFKEATKGLTPPTVQTVVSQYGTENRFWRKIRTDKLLLRGVAASERERIFSEVLRRRDYYGLTPHQLLTLAPPVYVKARIEGFQCLIHPWTLIHSDLACSLYIQRKPDEDLVLPGTRKAWFDFSLGAADAVFDPDLVLVDVYLPPPPKKVNETVVRFQGCEVIPQPRYTLPGRIQTALFGFTVLLDADGCADLPKLLCKAGIRFKFEIVWITSSRNTLKTAVPFMYLPLVKHWKTHNLITPPGKDVADDYVVDALEKKAYDVVVARDIALQNRCIKTRPETLLIGTPEKVIAQLEAYQKAFEAWPRGPSDLFALCAPVV